MADRALVSDVMYILRFIQVIKPIISFRIICFQVEQTNCIVTLAIYTPNFEEVNGAYWFRVVRPFVKNRAC